VYIQEGPPQLSSVAPATRGKNRVNSRAELQSLDPQRGARPVPGVEEFPAHAQREYWAKASEGEHRGRPPEPRSSISGNPDHPAQMSLLRRLAGAAGHARKVGDGQLPKHSSTEAAPAMEKNKLICRCFWARQALGGISRQHSGAASW
jgi:hypothetical protein